MKKASGSAAPEELLRTLAESMREYAVAVDLERRVLYWNASFGRKFGAPEPGSKLEDRFDPPALRALIKTAINGSSIREADVVSNHGGPQGSVYHVTAVPLRGDAPKLLLVIEDVSEQADQRNRMIANSRLVAVGEMAAGVAHELNNPLTAVLGFSQLAVRQTNDPALRRDLEAIAHEAERAGHIVDNLLGFARAHSGLGDYFDPAASLQKILDLREYECRVNNIEVVTYFDPDTPKTRADAHRMEQVFLNLLGNAIQAIAEGPGRGSVTVGLVAIDGLIRMSFTDDGPGIPEDVIGHIFEPFYTTKPVGKGTGLGLSICREIVRDHGGEIRVESHARRGTTFVVEIPIVPIAEPEEKLPEAADAPQSFSMLKILAVDDEPVITDLLSRALSGLGHEVDTASDGAEALRKINLAEYDAIILDVKMPGLGGPEVLRCIEGLRPEIAKRVLFITGDTVSPSTQAFFQSEGHEALHKPFSLEELRKRLQPFAVAKDLRASAGSPRKRPDLTAGISRISKKR
jgi:two-component system NtrC family sensor kinase